LTLDPDEHFPLNRQVFCLDAGLPGRARALVIERRPTETGSSRKHSPREAT